MPDTIKQNATFQEISGKNLLILNDPEAVYLVNSEQVEVFAVPLRDGKPRGVRTFLFSAEHGSLLFGLDPEGFGTGLGLVVSGKPGSSVLVASRTELREVPASESEEIRHLVHNWTSRLLLALNQGVPPRETFHVDPGIHELKPQQHARAGTGFKHLWIRHLSGKSQYFSSSFFVFSSEQGFFPLPAHSWITCLEESSLECLSDREYQEVDPDYSTLDQFHNSVLRFILEQQSIKEKEELHRQEEMTQNDQARISATMNLLAQAMESGETTLQAKALIQDELLNACIRVGQETGIEVNEPPREARINTDPLQAVAKGSNFRIRQVALKGEWWKYDAGPMLGFVKDSETGKERPVCLLQKSQGTYILEDPQTGEQRKINSKVNEELTYFGYLFYRPMPYRPLNAMDLIHSGFIGLRRDILLVILMGIGAGLLALLPPIATGILFDTIIPDADRIGLLHIGAILVSAAIAVGLFEATKMFSTMRISSKIEFRIQSGIMDRLLSLPTSFFRKFTAGDLADRTMGINAIREILSGVTLYSIMGGIFSSFSLVLLFYYSWKLAMVAMGITLISGAIMLWIGIIQLRYQRIIQRLQGKLAGMVLQFISGISKLRVSGTEERAFAAWAETFSSMRKSTFQATKVENRLHAFTQSLRPLSLLIIFGWIIFTPLIGTMSVGDIVAFNSAFAQFQLAMIQLAMTMVSSLQVVPLYERAKPILEAEPELDADKAGPGELTGHIEINNVSFRYVTDGPLILRDVSLEINPGEFVAIVGGSGSGKTTLFRLLLGFETPESGSIYYDAQDLKTLDVVAVRRQLGVVLQNSTVMPGDIYSNIVGSASMSMDQAWEAARMAGMEEDIRNMPMGMHTMVTPGGGTLSGGQRQRLLISRAIVHRPRILFFDEATSALDNYTQKIVSQSLEQLNSTRVVIAHRLSTIMNADRIFVLDKGLLAQQGTYQELMNQPGLFAELARRQVI